MSISVSNLTKIYGEQKAVDGVTFEARPGEILGFLGPNGAGKSTTMKIATTYLPPSSGEVYVCGFNVLEEPIKIKSRIGYLPEHNPLYTEMYVKEFLAFTGKLHGLTGNRLKDRIAEVIQLCGLGMEQGKKIEALSKGYRQRVGIAQALIHDPEVLILDEPTTGLDPNQIIEIRNLIKKISVNKTVIFSTHIMQEVQAICDRVVVINNGRVVADDNIDQLKFKARKMTAVEVEFSEPAQIEDLEKIEGVQEVIKKTNHSYVLHSEAGVDIRPAVFAFANKNELTLVGMTREEVTMENVFQDLTKPHTK
ncbi:MAG: gliding motility-associated ABC transporter ATP-binding subunit GldA [Fulvivirga sp.]|nr:gliding motility-associated ABC transporter ATP-binding subunit GldA [Fulvivirga sp.]